MRLMSKTGVCYGRNHSISSKGDMFNAFKDLCHSVASHARINGQYTD